MSSFLSLIKRFPRASRSLLLVELAERSSYYGYRGILTLFLTTAALSLGIDNFTESEANALTHSNIALTYLMPILGGLLADWFFGRYFTLIFFALVCSLGHGLLSLAFYYQQMPGMESGLGIFTIGLSCIAIGAGGLKPNSTSLFADSLSVTKDEQLLESGFQAFYFMINVGALISFLVVPYVADTRGYEWAFGIPGVLMLAAALILFIERKRYPRNAPLGYQPNNFVTINLRGLRMRLSGKREVWASLGSQYPVATERVLAMWRIARYFVYFIMAWAIFDLNGSDWVIDSKYLDRNVGSFEIPAGSIQMLNTIFVLLFVPLSLWFFNYMREKKNWVISTEKKVFYGMLLLGISVVLEAVIRMQIDEHVAVFGSITDSPNANHNIGLSVGWQIIVYAFLSAGEVLFSIGGLELGYRLGPPELKSTILSIFYLSTAAGNLFVQFLHTYRDEGEWLHALAGANLYWFLAALLLVNAVLYYRYIRRVA